MEIIMPTMPAKWMDYDNDDDDDDFTGWRMNSGLGEVECLSMWCYVI